MEVNSLRGKREKKEKSWDKYPVDLNVVSKERQREDNSDCEDYVPGEWKGKYGFNTFGKMDDGMSDEYNYPRHGLRSGRTELYTVMSKLSSDL